MRWALTTRLSCGTLELPEPRLACCMTSQSESLPITMPTSGAVMTSSRGEWPGGAGRQELRTAPAAGQARWSAVTVGLCAGR